jgi:hypothetical protein
MVRVSIKQKTIHTMVSFSKENYMGRVLVLGRTGRSISGDMSMEKNKE